MKIPKCVYDDFYGFDKNKDGIITQKEINSLNGTDTIYDTSIFNVKDKMDVKTFIKENQNFYGAIVQYTNKKYTCGRKILQNGKLVSTKATRTQTNDSTKNIQVEQGEYALKTYSKDTPSIQTYNVCTCVAVTLYDKKLKKGFVAHIDKIDRAESLEKIIKQCNFNPKTTEARIIGGQTNSSEGLIEEIDETLKRFKVKVVEYDVLGKGHRNIQLDLKTGEVSDYEESDPTYKIAHIKWTEKQPLLPNQQSE